VAQEFLLPDIGEGLTEAEIVGWFVDVGDEVAAGQALCEVETAKAVVELPSPYAGVLLHRGAAEGETIEVGRIVAVLGSPGESWKADGASTETVQVTEAASTASAGPPDRAVRAMPVVRRLAKEHGVDLAFVTGTGPGGRITREDVLAKAAHGGLDEPADERVRLSATRRAISEHLTRSWSEIPHVTTYDDMDASALLSLRQQATQRLGRSVPLEALTIRAVVPALRAHPEFNASLEGDELVLRRAYDIGVAIDTPDGLLVPVVANAAEATLEELASRIDELAVAAADRSLTPEQLRRGTFTISNIGALGGGHGTPIIPLGTTAILSFGKAIPTPVARDGEVAIAPVMPLSLSYDHRVIDGALGRRFIDAAIAGLNDPALLD
jgi:pyruvate dehydrogenase E2 component (dihydrolipoamide acetyltransferase)